MLFPRLIAPLSSAPDLPEFSLLRVFTEWSLDPLLTIGSIWIAGLYLWGVLVLRRRGDRWPLGRTLSFVVVGMGSFFVATSSGISTYDTTLLSVHMVQHMILSMLVPLALALGAPVTLALRTLPGTTSQGPRSWLLGVLHSKVVAVLSFAPLTLALYVLSPWALYFSGWYPATLESTFLHEMMHVHLVLVGSLFFWPLMGIDPVPGRVAWPFRLIMVFLTLPFHAFLGVTIMGQDEIIAAEHYAAMREGPMGAWLPSAAEDQNLAGGILWGAGDLVALAFFGVLFVQWVRDSIREAAREDRRLDLLERRAAGAADAADATPRD